MSRGTKLAALTAAVTIALPMASAAADDPYQDFPQDAVVTVVGDGSGHGRGMSQYGAYSAARDGVGHRAIVSTYYPGTRWKQLGGSIEVLVSGDDDRDLVVQDVPGLKVRAVGSGTTWRAAEDRAKRWRVKPVSGSTNVVSYYAGRWRTWKKVRGDVELTAGSRPLRLSTPDGARSYRGALRSSRDDHGDRVTVNVVQLEQYVRGVVPSEMQAGWPQQALRAQAVASRTYAAWRRTRPLDVAYDICDTTLCQVYGGASAEASASNRAVKGTAREVLTYRRAPIFAEFSAANGGWTVDGGEPYLPSREDPYEGTSGDYYGWTVQVPVAEMLAEYNYDELQLIQIEQRDGNGRRGGRVQQVRVTAGSGFTDTVTGEAFRADWGLPSTLFTITKVQ
jgi:stage II sporulation protein D